MRSSLSKGLLVVGAMTAYFVGCGGSSVQRGTPNDDTKGHGGTSGSGASGGATGVGAGRNGGTGAQGGGTVGVGGGATRGGRGGGPHLDGGTSGTAGSAGDAVTAGSGGAPDPDPSCDCTVHEGEFSCTQETVSVPSQFADPAQCEVLDGRVKRELCDDGSTRYTFIVGEENDYRLEVDSDGNATYFRGSGYVTPGCGLDPGDIDYGTFTTGTPGSSTCRDACALCEDYDELPACLKCERDPEAPYRVLETLEEYCSQDYCPATVTEAREHVAGACNGFESAEIRTGCGVVTVTALLGFSEAAYTFDQQTGALVGVSVGDDVEFGPCRAHSYRAGNVPDSPCAGGSTCTLCAPDTGEAGAAGAAGAGGAGDGNLCP